MAVVVSLQASPQAHVAYQELLAARGYELQPAPEGSPAPAVLDGQPAAVILELRSPLAASLALLEELRRQPAGRQTVLLAVAESSDEDLITAALDAGADDVLVQPVRGAELLAKLRVGLHRRRPAHQEPTQEVVAGSIFADRFEILKPVSAGGFSQVYQARDLTGKWPGLLALKIFNPTLGGEESERFLPWMLREAAKLSSIDHPNIIQLYDIGSTADRYYLVMEYADGQSLDAILNEQGPLTEEGVIWIGCETAVALQYLDSHHIIHRDLKPGNLIVTTTGGLKLIDFGLAKSYGEHTLSGNPDQFRGTATYVSPERVRGGDELDIRSDLYSFGVTLYYAATCVLPFVANTLRETLDLRFKYTPPPVHTINPNISEELSMVIARLMSVDRAKRPSLPSLIATLTDLALAEGLSRQMVRDEATSSVVMRRGMARLGGT